MFKNVITGQPTTEEEIATRIKNLMDHLAEVRKVLIAMQVRATEKDEQGAPKYADITIHALNGFIDHVLEKIHAVDNAVSVFPTWSKEELGQ